MESIRSLVADRETSTTSWTESGAPSRASGARRGRLEVIGRSCA
jgi:hypothetical protein